MTAQPPPIPRSNLVARHWRGELPLGWAYWGIAVLGNVAAAIVTAAIGLALGADDGFNPYLIFAAVVATWVAIAIIVAWQITGTWRSASRHAARRREIGKRAGWAVAAKIGLVLGVLNVTGQFVRTGVPQFTELYKMAFLGDPEMPDFAFRVMRNGTEIELTGGFKFGLTNSFAEALAAAPGIRTVHLHSSGGRLGEAEKLATIIRERGLATYVAAGCASACTLAYSAGRERWIAPAGQLGFHGPAFPGMTRRELAGSVRDWKKQFLKAGFDAAFVDRALAVPNTDLWKPTLAELTAARVVTKVADGSQFAASGYGGTVDRDKIIDRLIRQMPPVAAARDRLPADYAAITTAYYDGYVAGRTERELSAIVHDRLVPLVLQHKALAAEDVLIGFATLAIDEYEFLGRRNPTHCYSYAEFGVERLGSALNLPARLTQREWSLGAQAIATSAPRPAPDPKRVQALSARVAGALTKRFGRKTMDLLQADDLPVAQHAAFCTASIALLREIIALPRADAAILLRSLYTR